MKDLNRISIPRDEREQGLNVHGLTKSRAKAWNDKHYDELTDADVDEALAQPDPPDNGR